MSSWPAVLQKPEDRRGSNDLADWFTQIASRLLNGSRLVAGGEPHRFTEIEFYYCGDDHPDPFTHQDPLQRECGRWYFHRSRGVYRSGSFKGFDLTFGDGSAFGGVLIRGLEGPDGNLIDGPSLCVDHLLRTTGCADVATLDETIAARPAWDAGSPLVLQEATAEERPLYRSGRVGLSLKRVSSGGDMHRYLMRSYRYLSEPRRISKGKAYLVLSLHALGHTPEEIQKLTGCPRGTVQRYIADFETGRQGTDFTPYHGLDLKPADLCRLHGVWHAQWGTPPAQ